MIDDGREPPTMPSNRTATLYISRCFPDEQMTPRRQAPAEQANGQPAGTRRGGRRYIRTAARQPRITGFEDQANSDLANDRQVPIGVLRGRSDTRPDKRGCA